MLASAMSSLGHLYNTYCARYVPATEPLRTVVHAAAGAAIVYATVWVVSKVWSAVGAASKASNAAKRRAAQQKDVVYVFGFPYMKGQQFSMPVGKLIAFLQLHKIKYEYVPTQNGAAISDTERLPCIELNGKQYCDSKFIIEHLEKAFPQCAANFTPRQQSMANFFYNWTQVFFQHVYRSTWVDSQDIVASKFAEATGYPAFMINLLFLNATRKNVINMLNAVGQGDLTDEQYLQQFDEDLTAIEEYLSTNHFLVTEDRPSKVDCYVAPMLAYVSRTYGEALKHFRPFAHAAGSPVIKAYLERVEEHLGCKLMRDPAEKAEAKKSKDE